MILYMYKPSCGNFRHFQRASQNQAVPALFLQVEQHHRAIQRCRLHLRIVLQPELSVARAFADATVSRCQKAASKLNSMRLEQNIITKQFVGMLLQINLTSLA
jgi:hypothetical protein